MYVGETQNSVSIVITRKPSRRLSNRIYDKFAAFATVRILHENGWPSQTQYIVLASGEIVRLAEPGASFRECLEKRAVIKHTFYEEETRRENR